MVIDDYLYPPIHSLPLHILFPISFLPPTSLPISPTMHHSILRVVVVVVVVSYRRVVIQHLYMLVKMVTLMWLWR